MGAAVTLVAAVDAGNSKIDALLVDDTGSVLARARGGGFRPQIDGVGPAMTALEATMAELLDGAAGPVDLVAAYLAGADTPAEEALLGKEIDARGWAERVVVGNDTHALLRCGAPAGWGVAVVCGAGINAIGVGPDGRTERFPALGHLTGDWGSGGALAADALWLAVRGEDGRGPRTALTAAVRAQFGTATATEAGVMATEGAIGPQRLLDLTPTLFRVAAAGDGPAQSVVDRLAGEVAGMALALIGRLGLTDGAVPVVLGGGVLTGGHDGLVADILRRVRRAVPRAECVVTAVAPVVGAAMLGLDQVGASTAATERLLRAERDRRV